MEYSIERARYAKGRFVVKSPKREDGLKSHVHWLLENVGARYVHRDGGYQLSGRQLLNFRLLAQGGFVGGFRIGLHSEPSFTHPKTGLKKYTLKEAAKIASLAIL